MSGETEGDLELQAARQRIAELEERLGQSAQLAQQLQAFQDYTLRRLQERSEELEHARDEALAAVRAKDEFLATMSHEIRTPMNAVMGCIDLLELGQTGARDQREELRLLATMRESSETLTNLLTDVLEFAQLGASRLVLDRIPHPVKTLVEDAIAPEMGAALSKGIRIEHQLTEGAPIAVRCDPGRVRQVLSALVSNAVKFTEHGEVRVTVSREASGLLFEVSDTGIGVQPEQIESIFGAFQQGDSSRTRQFGGTGLGLAIAQTIAAAMDAKIEVRSIPGRGSTFGFVLPLREDHGFRSEDREEPHDCSPGRCIGTKEPMRVLVVDDNPVNRMLAVRMFRRAGARVDQCQEGASAVRRVGSERFDLVLMDCTMPIMDGFEATRRIRALPGDRASVQILAFTALAMQGDRERCMAAGMDGYLPKPLRLEDVEELLRIRRAA